MNFWRASGLMNLDGGTLVAGSCATPSVSTRGREPESSPALGASISTPCTTTLSSHSHAWRLHVLAREIFSARIGRFSSVRRMRSEFARHVERAHRDIVVRVGAISALRLARQDSQAVEFCGVPIVNAKVPMRHDVAPL